MIKPREILKNNLKNALKKDRRVILAGIPGVGKKRFCYNVCKEAGKNFVFIDCEYDLGFLSNIRLAFDNRFFEDELRRMCGIMENDLNNTVLIFENIECSELFCIEIYPFLVSKKITMLMTMRVKNHLTEYVQSDCRTYIMRPASYLCIMEKYEKDDYKSIIEGNTKNVNPLPRIIHKNFEQECEAYMMYGGMPQSEMIFNGSEFEIEELKSIHDSGSLFALEKMLEYSDLDNTEKNKCRQIVQSVYKQMLCSDYTKFILKDVRVGATYALYKNAIDFLVDNNYLYRCNLIDNDKNFVLFFYDCGTLYDKLLQLSNKLGIPDANDKVLQVIRKNYVYNELLEMKIQAKYWKSEFTAHIDFVFELKGIKYLCKVLDNENRRDRSLDIFPDEEGRIIRRIKINSGNFGREEKKYNIPFYAISCIEEISI